MFRIIGAVLLVALAASFLSNGNGAVIWLAIIGALAVLLIPLLQGRTALRCPYCRKRVKLGAQACHHCGREVAR